MTAPALPFASFAPDEDMPDPKFSRFEKNGSSLLKVADVHVFRSGTFRDSIGYQHTYDDFQMEGFVRNFNHLRASGILPDIPVRKGHPSFGTNRMDGLIGYVTGLKTEKKKSNHDGQEYTYLIADFEIIEKSAIESIESGLWRNRSSEVGTYVDNNENEYAPCYMGCAYVDIPAVEGLNGFQVERNSVHFNMEDVMGNNTLPGTPGSPSPLAPAGGNFSFKIGGNDTTDYSRVQAYVTDLESQFAAAQASLAQKDATISGLQEFKDSLQKAAKDSFVTSLVDSGKIKAPKKAEIEKMIESYSDEQFESFKSFWDSVESNPLFNNHGGQESREPLNSVDEAEGDNATQIAKDIVFGLKNAGTKTETIKASKYYQQVLAAEPNFDFKL